MAAFSEEKKLEISGFFLSLLALFPILRPALQSIILLLFTVSSIVLYWKLFSVRIKKKKVVVIFLVLTAYYLWHILSLFWSADKEAGVQMLQSNILLLLFPIIFIFFYPSPSEKNLVRIQKIFVFAMLVLSFFWFNSYITGLSYYQELKLNESPISEYSLFEQLKYFFVKGYYWLSGSSTRGYRMAGESSKMFLHHGYLSAYFLLAFLFCLRLIGSSKSNILKGLLVLLSFLFLSFIIYLPSVVNKLAALITTPIVLYQYLSKKMAISMLALGCLGLIFFIVKNQNVLRNIKLVEKEHLMSTEPAIFDYFRYHTYSCVAEKIPENALLGMGAGDVQTYLNNCLPDEDWPGLSESRRQINTHSQFLHYFISGGFIGLLLFFLLWYKLFSWAIQPKQRMLFVVLVIVLINSLFENFLSRIWGAFFFVYFTFLFLQLNIDQIRKSN